MAELTVKKVRRPIGNASPLPVLEQMEPSLRTIDQIYEMTQEWSENVKTILWQLKRQCEEVSFDTDTDIRDLDDRTATAKQVITNQVGGTNQDYDAVTGAINGSNQIFTVARGEYDPNTLSVFLSGHRQGESITVDWVPLDPGVGTFKMNVAPVSPDTILVKYTLDVVTAKADYIIETTTDTLSGLINGSNKVFTTTSAYISGNLRVWQGKGGAGQLQIQGDSEDWAETTSTTFTMTVAPIAGDVIGVVYQSAGVAIEQIDQSGGTNDTYGVIQGDIDGSNTRFVVSKGNYKTKTLLLENNGQGQTQGDNEDWQQGNSNVGLVEFETAPEVGDEIIAIYQTDSTALDHTHHDPGIDVTDDYTVRPADKNIRVDATDAAVTVTLPVLNTGAGLEFNVSKVDASVNAVIVQGTGGETINGDSTLTINFRYSTARIRGHFTEYMIA